MDQETPNQEQATTTEVPTASNDRDSILAEMEALTDEGETVAEPVAEAEESENDEDTPEDAEETEDSDDVADDDTPEPEVQIDSKKMATLQREQKRHQEEADTRTLELDKREAELNGRETGNQAIDDLRSRAAIDPVGVLEALGLKPESFEDAARDFYNRRPEARVDRHVAQRDMKLREANSEAAEARSEVKALREEIKQDKMQREVAADFQEYMTGAKSAVSESAPIVANLLKANPERFREEVASVCSRIWKETGERPDQVDVIAELEQTKYKELEELGVTPPTSATKKPAQSPKNPVGKTITNNLGTSTQTRDTDLSEDDLRQDVLRGMDTLD